VDLCGGFAISRFHLVTSTECGRRLKSEPVGGKSERERGEGRMLEEGGRKVLMGGWTLRS